MIARVLGTVVVAAAAACDVSISAEDELGDQYASALQAQLPILEDPVATAWLTELGRRLTRVPDDASRDWHFYLVDDSTVNAFAVPGGHVFLHRGLIDRAATYAELAGVMGHEVAHVTLRHSVDQLKAQTRTSVIVAVLCSIVSICGSSAAQVALDVGGQALFAKYSRDDEREADSAAVGFLVEAGIDPRGLTSMFERFAAQRGRDPTALDNWFGSHPLEESRIARTTGLIEAFDRRRLDSLASHDVGYAAFREAVRAR